jgi:hypothetical protein
MTNHTSNTFLLAAVVLTIALIATIYYVYQ